MSLVWSEKFATGVDSIDRQHTKLFSVVNRLEYFVSTNICEGPEVDHLLDFLSEYVVVHFNHEEYCMELTNCPVAEQNKIAHEEFLRFFTDFRKEYKIAAKDKRGTLLSTLQREMEKWLSGHICKIDIQLRNLRQPVSTSAPASN